jgi:hypothetical protein
VLVYSERPSWVAPGFTGEVFLTCPAQDLAVRKGAGPAPLDVFVASGSAEAGGPLTAQRLAGAGTETVAVAPDAGWELEPRLSVGPPFGVPEPVLLAARHLSHVELEERCAYLRVVEGLPKRYVLVEGSLLGSDEGPVAGGSAGRPAAGTGGPGINDQAERVDLAMALQELADVCLKASPANLPPTAGGRVEIVRLGWGPLTADGPDVEDALRQRRAETEEGRYQPEDWPGYGEPPSPAFRATSPFDVAAAVAGADAVVAASGALLALAWALGVPHVALGPEGSPADAFVAWTGDASALVQEPSELLAATGHILARRGTPPGLKRLEATVDQSLDEAAAVLGKIMEQSAAVAGADGDSGASLLATRTQELQAVNEALRQRMAVERRRFGERSALLEKTANTNVQAAIKAVHGQDVITRRRLEVTEREMHRLQEETAVQQAELRALHATMTMRLLAPARQYYGRLKKAVR